jgi:hypothetical protein
MKTEMQAIVKEIEVNTIVTDEEDSLYFVKSMKKSIGKKIKIAPFHDSKNWFVDVERCWIYHRSWLEFVE